MIRLFYKNYNIQSNNYDLVIYDISKLDEGEHLNELIDVLLRNRIQYFTHDENNEEKRHYYNKEQLEETLKQTPVKLGKYFCYNHLSDALVDLIKTNAYFKWTLSEIK